jgi:hypothetical protein
MNTILLALTVACAHSEHTGEHNVQQYWANHAPEVSQSPEFIPPQTPTAPVVQDRRKELSEDDELGKKYSAEVEKDVKVSSNKEMTKRLERIGADIAAIANVTEAPVSWGDPALNRFEYKFKLIEGEDVNAFSIPGGYIYVYEGLMKYGESDAEIAGVLAHEVAHAAQRHVVTLRRQAGKFDILTIPLILAALISRSPELLAAGSLTSTALTNGWTYEAEQSADAAAFAYMAKSTYNSTGLLTFMERLARDERSTAAIDWGIYRTHPPGQRRADAITRLMKEAGIPIRRSLVTTSFSTTVEPAENESVLVKFGRNKIVTFSGDSALERADAASEALNAFFDEGAEVFEVTSSPDGVIYGKRRPLFKLTAEDAIHAKLSYEDFRKATVKNVREAIFTLAFRVWNRQ